MKKSVTIGLPVYNEERNIKNMISSITHQNSRYYFLKEIILLSDGSTDATNKIINELTKCTKKIRFIKSRKRIGKAKRANQMFRMSDSDVFVLLDADVFIYSNNVIDNLVLPFIKKNVDLTSGIACHKKPKTFFERILATGLDVWDFAKTNTDNSEMYTCEGQIRAFSKRLYKKLKFPNQSADDVYPYLYCKKNGFIYKFAKQAKIYYKLPSTYRDYLSQHVRYLNSRKIHEANFGSNLIINNYSIGFQEKLRALRYFFLRKPLYLSLYLLLLIVPKILVHLNNEGRSSTWSIITSTK